MAKLNRGILFRQLDRLCRDGTFTAQTDAQLLERYLLRRDEAAFEALVNLHGPMVLSLCRRFLRDPRDIEDAFQATFLILARRACSIRKREVLSSWLYGVAYRVAVRSRSDVLRRRSYETAVPSIDGTAGIGGSEFDEIGPILDQELRRLPEKLRAPLVLCYLKDHTHDQAAAELRWPVGTVRSRLARGRELLRERLTRRGYAPMASMLGLSPGVSLRSFLAPVPPGLVRSTVVAANRFGSVAMGGTAAHVLVSNLSGSATTLAQGVLTTMALSQIKMLGAGLVAIGLMAGGLGAGAWALGSPGQGQQPSDAPPPAARRVMAQGPHAPPPVSPPQSNLPQAPPPASRNQQGTGFEARLAELERKLDLLLEQRLGDIEPQSSPLQGPSRRNQSLPKRQWFYIPNPDRRSVGPPPGPAGQPPADADVPLLPPPAQNLERSPFDFDAQSGTRPTNLASPSRVLPSPGMPPPRRPRDGDDEPQRLQPEDDEALQPVRVPPSRQVPPVARQGRAESPDGAADPFQPARPRGDVLVSSPTDRTSIREIEAQLSVAIRRYERVSRLLQANVVSREEYDNALDQIRLLVGRLRGLDDELKEDLERLDVERMKKEAELKVAEARQQVTAALVARNTRLNNRKPGMVGTEDVTKDDSNDSANMAQIEVKKAEIQDVYLRAKQFRKRREMAAKALESAMAAIPELAKEQQSAQSVPPLQPREER